MAATLPKVRLVKASKNLSLEKVVSLKPFKIHLGNVTDNPNSKKMILNSSIMKIIKIKRSAAAQ